MTQPVARVTALPECLLYSDLADENGESMGITVRRRQDRKLVTGREDTLNVKWGEGRPHLVELTGAINPPARATGLHVQMTRAVKVWLDGKLVLNAQPGAHRVKHKFAARVPVRFRLTCAEQPGAGKVYVGWRGLGDHVVPAQRKVYLPRGDWFDFWTNERLRGGRTITRPVFGAFSIRLLPLNLMPDISYPKLTVRTEYPGAAPAEVEDNVSRPLEELLGVVTGLTRIESISRAGASDVVLEFAWDTDMDEASQDVLEKLDLVRPNLPDGVMQPLMLRYDRTLDPVLTLSLSARRALRR